MKSCSSYSVIDNYNTIAHASLFFKKIDAGLTAVFLFG